MKYQPHVAGIIAQAPTILFRPLAEDRTGLTGEFEQATRLQALQMNHIIGGESLLRRLHVDHLAADHAFRARCLRQTRDQPAAHLRVRMRARIGQEGEGDRQQPVSRKHGRRLVECFMRGRSSAP